MKIYYNPLDISILKNEKGEKVIIKNFMNKLHNLPHESKIKIKKMFGGSHGK